MSIEAMKQALEALEEWEKSMSKGSLEAHRILRTAIEQAEKQEGWVLREVLFDEGEPIAHREPAQQEPVAWAVFEGWNAHDLYLPQECDEALKMAGYKGDHAEVKPLYTTLPAAQRPWVGLTDDDFQSICANFRVAHGGWVDMLVLQIEAKLKEKNIG